MDTDLLGSIPLFTKLSPNSLNELAQLLTLKKFDAHQPVFWIGDSGSDFYIVRVGRIALTYPDDKGREVNLASLGPGEFFGELSLLDGGPRTATARAQSVDTHLLTLGRHQFFEFLGHNPEAATHIVTVLGQRQREMLGKMRSVANVNTVFKEHSTLWHRIADGIAAMSASQGFVLFHLVIFGSWMVFNAIVGERGFDPFPFGLLTMVSSMEAIFLSIFVLISQNRSGEKDRIRADLDYQVNLKAQHEIMQLHHKLDDIQKMLGNQERQEPLEEAETISS